MPLTGRRGIGRRLAGDGGEDLGELLERLRVQRGRGGTHEGGADPSAPAEDLLADTHRRARRGAGLALESDQRQPPVEERAGGAPPPRHELVANDAQGFGVGEAGHGPVGAAGELLEEVAAARPPKMDTRRSKRARSRVILGKVGASSSFTASTLGISATMRPMKAGGITTWVVTGSSCSTMGRGVAAATAW